MLFSGDGYQSRKKNSSEPSLEPSPTLDNLVSEKEFLKLRELKKPKETLSDSSYLGQLREQLKNAQKNVDDACKCFDLSASNDEDNRTQSQKIKDAINFLDEADQFIKSFCNLLFKDLPLLPIELLENRQLIKTHIDSFIEQIEEYLIQEISRGKSVSFSMLKTALRQINELF